MKERKKKNLNPNPGGCLPGDCETWTRPKPALAKREITGLKWETSLQKLPGVVFGKCFICIHVCLCGCVFQSVGLFFIYVFSSKTLFKNNVEAVL